MSGRPSHVAILGGGLAGMSAAAALSSEGHRITLIEKRARLGGRAGSHLDAATGKWIDNCQHVLMPCCTNLLDFYRRIGVEDRIRFHPEIPFIGADGRVSRLRSSFLPAPLHCLPSFLALGFIGSADKFRIARGLASLIRGGWRDAADGTSARDWLLAHGQTAGTLANFWHPVLVSALNEDLERAAVGRAAQVFLEAFLSHPRGWWLGVPTAPLSALYGESFTRSVEERGGSVLLQQEARALRLRDAAVTGVELGSGETIDADAAIVALPWEESGRILPEGGALEPLRKSLESLEPSPITGVHLWFDRPVTDLDFAALPGRSVHWLFNKSRNFERVDNGPGYLQLVTSASRSWMDMRKGEILRVAMEELSAALPAVRQARLLESCVLKEPAATFSPSPDSEGRRPSVETEVSNLFLAGDWVRTGWPATMEGAVRAGYQAAEAVLRREGRKGNFLVADLAPTGLMRLAGRA